MPIFIGGDYATDAGMVCLWDPEAFRSVVDYDTWEEELCEDRDILRHIKAGHLTPINTNHGVDGAFAVIVRIGDDALPASLTEREARYILAESAPYRFQSSGRICVSGLEYIEAQPGPSVGVVPMPTGEYMVKLYFIAWDDEPGMKDRKGRPKPGALPDFVLLVNPKPKKKKIRFRTKLHALEPLK
ncbi:MAG TPA: hypothetical protein VFE62_02650 [Gemmataceae bacterium]|nr:hypothetical protein [Gemmataceae bacterium]